MKYLVKQIFEEEILEYKVKQKTDGKHLPRGGGYIFVEGIETDYPKVITNADGNLEVVEDLTLKDQEEYKKLRKKEYPSYGDQLDLIYKMTKHLKENGLDIGIDGDNFLGLIEAVKIKHPKPVVI